VTHDVTVEIAAKAERSRIAAEQPEREHQHAREVHRAAPPQERLVRGGQPVQRFGRVRVRAAQAVALDRPPQLAQPADGRLEADGRGRLAQDGQRVVLLVHGDRAVGVPELGRPPADDAQADG
jgi:hypothetical protein